jgi:hypothetical protein
VRDNDQILMEQLYTEAYSEREEMIMIYSDRYKDIHGVRPRWMRWDEYSDEEVKQEYDRQSKQYSEYIDQENKKVEKNDQEFKQEIEMLKGKGAKDEKQAIEWMLQSDNIKYPFGEYSDYMDFEYWLSQQELSYGLESKIKKLLEI